jgi:hypothetical protein
VDDAIAAAQGVERRRPQQAVRVGDDADANREVPRLSRFGVF